MPRPEDLDALLSQVLTAAASDMTDAEFRSFVRLMAKVRDKMATDPDLTTVRENATVNAMNASEPVTNALRSRGRLRYGDNAFVRAMVDKGETIADVAALVTAKLGRPFHRNTVQGWYVPVGEPSHRDIPRDAAEAIRDHYGKDDVGAERVPLASWPRVRG